MALDHFPYKLSGFPEKFLEKHVLENLPISELFLTFVNSVRFLQLALQWYLSFNKWKNCHFEVEEYSVLPS